MRDPVTTSSSRLSLADAAGSSAAWPRAAPDVTMAMMDTVPAAAVVLMRIDPPVTADDSVRAPLLAARLARSILSAVYELVRLCQAGTGGAICVDMYEMVRLWSPDIAPGRIVGINNEVTSRL